MRLARGKCRTRVGLRAGCSRAMQHTLGADGPVTLHIEPTQVLSLRALLSRYRLRAGMINAPAQWKLVERDRVQVSFALRRLLSPNVSALSPTYACCGYRAI